VWHQLGEKGFDLASTRGGHGSAAGSSTGHVAQNRRTRGGAELRLPLGTTGGFMEKEWGERGGGTRLGDGEGRREKKKGGGSGRGVGCEVKEAPARERRCRAAACA
jgi:hypothetical protein